MKNKQRQLKHRKNVRENPTKGIHKKVTYVRDAKTNE